MNVKPRIIPFQPGKPITDPDDFAGRRKILQEISTAMLNMQNVSLHGERRTGKTSLLCYLAHPAFSSAIELPVTHIPVYIDFQAFAGASAASVWQVMADATAEQVRQRCPDRRHESEEFLTVFSAPRGASEPSVTDLGRALSYLGTAGLKIHLLLDEFDQTINNPNLRDPFYDALRSLPTGKGKSLSYIVATRTGLVALQPVYNKASSPLFNIFIRTTLGPFSEDEAHHLIFDYFSRAGLNLSLAERLCTESAFLRDVTGYHPFFLQTLCYYLCAHLDTPDWPLGQARQEALRAFEKDSEEHFAYYWKQSSVEEQELMEKIALKEPLDRNRLEPVAKRLRDRCLLVPPDSGWQLVSSAFARWIQKPATLYSAGIEYLNRQSWEEAAAAFQEVVRIDPKYKDAQQRLDEVKERARKFEDLEALYRMGKVCFENKQWEAAIDYLRRIVDSGEQYKDVAALLGEANEQLRLQSLYAEAELQFRAERWARAITIYEEIVRDGRTYEDSQAKLDHARVQLELRGLYERMLRSFSEENWSLAIKILGEIREKDPEYCDIVVRLEEAERQKKLAELYEVAVGSQETGNWKVAIEKYREIIREAGGYGHTIERLAQIERELARLVNRGESYSRRRKWKEAAEEFEQVHSIDPDFRGVKAKLEEALSHLRPEELRRRGEASLRVKDWEEAAKIFDELCRLDPKDVRAAEGREKARKQLRLDNLYHRGVRYFQRARWGKARTALERVTLLDPAYRDGDAAAKLKIAQERLRHGNVVTRILAHPIATELKWIIDVLDAIVVVVTVTPFVIGLIAGLNRFATAFRTTPTPKPPTLCNGTFDNKFECWEHGGELRQSVKCEGGQCYAVLGSPDYNCEGGVPVGEAWIKQSFLVPQTISPTLSLQYRVFSYDLNTYDFFQVSINGEPVGQFGNTEWTVSYCDSAVWDSDWRTVEFDLSSCGGEMVEVFLRNVNGTHGWWNTWTYVDDVEIR